MGNESSTLANQLAELREELEALRNQLRGRDDFKNHLRRARKALKGCKDKQEVVVLLGGRGAGKTTVSHYVFEVEGDPPADIGDDHGTTEISGQHSGVLDDAFLLDTIGKMPDARGMMRVLACVYNKGFNPVAIIVVHTGRAGYFDEVASHLQGKINVVDFSPRVFWRQVTDSGIDVDRALESTIFAPHNAAELRNIHALGFQPDGGRVPFSKALITDGNIPYERCELTDNLLQYIEQLNWERDVPDVDGRNASTILSYYMVQCISKRSTFEGSDRDFIDLAD